MKAAIAIDDWKATIFEKILTEEGYNFKTGPGLTKDMKLIAVEFILTEFNKLQEVVKRCERKAKELKS